MTFLNCDYETYMLDDGISTFIYNHNVGIAYIKSGGRAVSSHNYHGVKLAELINCLEAVIRNANKI